jgi:ADP-ribose pyrophosphatase YjhB (NUDIX family)
MISCTFENGSHTTTLRHVSIDAIALKKGTIVLVKRAEQLAEGGKWALPGGYLSHDEDLASAAVREFTEETGWSATIRTCFCISCSPKRENDPKNWQNINFTFILDVQEKIGIPDWESSRVASFPLDACPSAAELAFDHAAIIDLYRHTDQSMHLPIIRW